jgi:GH18 family chitinase
VLNIDRITRPLHVRPVAWSFFLLLPVIAGACISVSDDGEAAGSPSALPSTLTAPASPTLAPLATATPGPTPVPTPEPVGAEVVGFLPNWLIDDAIQSIDTDLLTILAFHGVEASGDGRLVSKKPSGDVPSGWKALESSVFMDLKERLQADGVKVVPTIQRFGWNEGTAARTEALLAKKKDRRALASRIASFVQNRGFDGVNLDFEPIPKQLTDDYSAFVREVREALDEVDPALHLSVDVVASLSGYDLAALTADDAADLAIIMGYNYRSDGAGVAGSMAPLSDPATGDLSTTVSEALAQVAADKLVLALPWYGKAWSTEEDKARSATVSGKGIDGASEPSYARAVELASQAGRRYQPDQASAWTVYADRQCASCPAVWRQVWYDDPDSFGAKIDYALEQDLAGVGVWALGHEAGREEMWWALRDRLRPRVDDSPPNGSAALDPEAVKDDLEGRDVIEGVAPLRLFPSGDTTSADVAVFTRIGLAGEVDGEGRLVTGRTYPAVSRIDFPLADASTGGSSEPGPRSIYVQWRDLAGNWSMPLLIEAWVLDPEASRTPADL